MVKLKRTLVPENGMSIDNIIMFETQNFYGFYSDALDCFTIMEKSGSVFNIGIMPHEHCNDLERMDEFMREEYGEEITGVNSDSAYAISIL